MKFLQNALLGLYDAVVFYGGVLLFGLICMSWSLLAALLYPVLPRRLGRTLGRAGIRAAFRFFLFSLELSGRFRFELDVLDELKDERGLIIACNHPSLWDAVMIVSRLPNVACIMKAEVINNVFLGAGARLARYIRNGSLRQMINLAVGDLERGSKVLLFPEGTRTVRRPLNPLKGSLGVIAARARVPVQTILIETSSPFLGKGWPVYKKPSMPLQVRVRLGRRFEPGLRSEQLVRELEQHLRNELGSAPQPESAPQEHSFPVAALPE